MQVRREVTLTQQARPSEVPLYQKIADKLRADILTGKYGPGDRLPSETELMEIHGVSRGTAREALGVLRSEGLADSRRGAGVFVRSFRPIRRNATERLSSRVWGAGRSIWDVDVEDRPMRASDVVVKEVTPPARVSGVLGLPADGRTWMRSRIYRVEGRPVQRAVSYLPADLVAGSPITEADPGAGGIYARLADLGHAPARFREEIKARMPTAEEASALVVPTGTPVIEVVRTAFDEPGRPVEVNEMLLDASTYLLQYDFSA